MKYIQVNPLLTLRLVIAAIGIVSFIGCSSDWEKVVIIEVTQKEAEYAETQRSGDFKKQSELHSDEYSYIDVSGKKVTKDEIDFRRSDDMMVSVGLITSEQEVIPLSPNLAIARGKQEGLSIYYGGIPRIEPTRYMAVWRKENGEWKILADQVTPLLDRTISKPVIEVPDRFDQFAGNFQLSTDPPVIIRLAVANDTLRLTIPERLDTGMVFLPTYDSSFFSRDRPWQIKYHSLDSITFISWGQLSNGKRIE